jgi:CubicO group peptidase (beta-lactamase class C family)
MAVNFAAMTYSAIRTAMVLEGGKIVASYVRDGVDGGALFDAYSTTKSWVSMLVGILIDEGKLTVTTTLGDIFRNQTVWAAVGDVDFRKAITVSGLCRWISLLQNHIPFSWKFLLLRSLDLFRSKNCSPILVDCRFHSLQLCTLP